MKRTVQGAASGLLGISLAAVMALPAQAAAPTVGVSAAYATGDSSATVVGFFDAYGSAATLSAAYALKGEPWCTSNGAEGKPHRTAAKSFGASNAFFSEVVIQLTGLEPGSEYCVAFVAEKPEDEFVTSRQVDFGTPVPPTIESEDAARVTSHDANLEATIDPNGAEETTYELFLEAPWCGSRGLGACEASGGVSVFQGTIPAGSGVTTVSVDVAAVWHALDPDTTYGYRFVAKRGDASAFGNEKTFTTEYSEEGGSPSTGGDSDGSQSSGQSGAGEGPQGPGPSGHVGSHEGSTHLDSSGKGKDKGKHRRRRRHKRDGPKYAMGSRGKR